MSKIYAVGVMTLDLNNDQWQGKRQERLWYFFANFQDAEKCVLENQYDIFECGYNVALIEDHNLIGTLDDGWSMPTQWWYRAEYEPGKMDPHKIVPIDQPACFRGICNVWAG